MESSAQSDAQADAALSQAIERLWVRFLPDTRQRISILEAAAAAVASNTLTPSQCQEAHDAAHKLAGALGTFNLPRGTNLARELELIFSPKNLPGPGSAERLAAATADLRAMVENRTPNG